MDFILNWGQALHKKVLQDSSQMSKNEIHLFIDIQYIFLTLIGRKSHSFASNALYIRDDGIETRQTN